MIVRSQGAGIQFEATGTPVRDSLTQLRHTFSGRVISQSADILINTLSDKCG